MSALAERAYALRCQLIACVLNLKVDAKLTAFVRAVLSARVNLDDPKR